VNDPSSSASGGTPASDDKSASDAAPAPTPAAPAPSPQPPAAASSWVATRVGARTMLSGNAWLIGAALVGTVSVISLTLVLLSQQRIRTLEQELVRRQQDSQGQAIEARALAKQAQDTAHASEAKLALLEARVAENALQRSQLEELIQQLSRSRDENVLADVDSAIRVAVQQSAITGSAEPLISALRQAEERLARMNQPRLERVRRALARDIDRVRAEIGRAHV
jgi:uroporphyrin-3 C-methyltransferase